MDYEGIKTLLRKADERFPRLSHLWLDAGYRGEDKGAEWVEKTLGWSVEMVAKKSSSPHTRPASIHSSTILSKKRRKISKP